MVAPQQTLRQGLQWYLEKYLELPVDGFQKRAEEVQAALSKWGRDCFDALFGGWQARDWYRDARQKGLFGLQFEIVSDDAAVLSWPWEAFESEHDGRLALQCRIERRLDNIGDSRPLSEELPKEQLNILYIIARPYGDNDVGFQTLLRPLIDFVNQGEGAWPVHIDVLRPPTFDQLRAVLKEKKNFYHVVHFDGHGGFGDNQSSGGGYMDSQGKPDRFAGPSGVLLFEKSDDNPAADEISATTLGDLLQECNIPVMVLNACQSAMVDENAADPFASVAVNLLRIGVRGVIAMSYNLWVSGAEVFVPAFYKYLFKEGDIAGAMQAGRQEMRRNQKRDTSYGEVEFHDWIVPVLYQQAATNILPALKPGIKQESALDAEIQKKGDYGFIGRDRAIHRLEQAIRRKPAGILIHGMAGEGKTTLAKGFLQWLEATNGLDNKAFWFSFEDPHSASPENIINTLAGNLFGINVMALSEEKKLAFVIRELRENRYFIIWDNFESASGIPGTDVSAFMSEEDRMWLKQFLHELRGGKTKILITSRSPEDEGWLSLQDCHREPLRGLVGEELWKYCNAVVSDFGLSLNRKDEAYRELLNKLAGNPLAIRAILLRLAESGCTSSQLAAELEKDFSVAVGDMESRRIQVALSVFGRGLDNAFAPMLRLLGMHKHFVYADHIDDMLKATGKDVQTDQCFAALERAGLCRHIGNRIYKLHPALRTYLAQLHPANEAEQRAFIDVMDSLVCAYAPKKLHEQRYVFALFGANFHRALRLARELDMRKNVLVLAGSLALIEQQTRNFLEAERMFTQLAEDAKEYNNANIESSAYHHLGLIAQERLNFATAVKWHMQSLYVMGGDKHGLANTCFELGRIATAQWDLVTADERFKQSLEIFLKQGDEHGAALTYHELGNVAASQRDFTAAKEWYKKSLDIKLEQGDEYGAALTYNQLGLVSEKSEDFAAAEDWYKKALTISLKYSDEYTAAITYNQLGILKTQRQEFTVAEDWLKQSLAILLKFDDEHKTGKVYHQLGNVAFSRCDFDTAEDWYKKSLDIKLKYDDEYGAALTSHQLGNLAQERRDFDAAEGWYKKSLDIELKQGNEYGAALTSHQLGNLAQKRRDFDAAEGWYKKSIDIELKQGNEHSAAIIYGLLGILAAQERRDFAAAEDWFRKALDIFERYKDKDRANIVKNSLDRLNNIRNGGTN